MRRSLFRVVVVVAGCACGLIGTSNAATARHAAAASVTVTFTDTTFLLSSASLESGATTFVVVNNGKNRHVFAIKGPGVRSMHTAPLAPGRSAKLTVQLRAGAYVLSDPVGLGPYNVQFLDIVQATTMTAHGNDSVASPLGTSPMCSGVITP